MITAEQILLLQNYRDMSYVSNILSEQSSDYYLRLKNIISFPLIISSSALTILNSSSFSSDDMKIPNIIINACTSLLLSFMNNFKFIEKANNFKSVSIKFNKLTHSIETKMTNDMNNITTNDISNIINEYDNLNEQLDFSYPNHIKTKIKNIYKTHRKLPAILNCEENFINTV